MKIGHPPFRPPPLPKPPPSFPKPPDLKPSNPPSDPFPPKFGGPKFRSPFDPVTPQPGMTGWNYKKISEFLLGQGWTGPQVDNFITSLPIVALKLMSASARSTTLSSEGAVALALDSAGLTVKPTLDQEIARLKADHSQKSLRLDSLGEESSLEQSSPASDSDQRITDPVEEHLRSMLGR